MSSRSHMMRDAYQARAQGGPADSGRVSVALAGRDLLFGMLHPNVVIVMSHSVDPTFVCLTRSSSIWAFSSRVSHDRSRALASHSRRS